MRTYRREETIEKICHCILEKVDLILNTLFWSQKIITKKRIVHLIFCDFTIPKTCSNVFRK